MSARPLPAVTLVASLWAALAFAAPPKRPKVDAQAMEEAMKSSSAADDHYSSSASYAHFLRARLLHDGGEHKRALDELRLALVTDEGNPYLLTALAEEYARLSLTDDAERELKKVLDRYPNYHAAHLLLGRVLLDDGKYTRAKVHLRRAVKLSPLDEDGYLVLTQLHVEQNQFDDAISVVEELGEKVPEHAHGFKRLALVLADRGDANRALGLLQKASARDPSDFETWANLAQLHEAKGNLPDAEYAYERALSREPDNKEALLAAGRLALRGGGAVRARALFEKLLSLTDEPELAVKVAFSFLAAQQLDDAAAVLESARRKSPAEPRLAFYAGLIQERLRRHPLAAEAYATVPPASELFHEARLRRAMALSSAGQHKAALALFKEGVAEKPGYLLLYPAYARALERAGQPREAESLLQKALAERPSPEIYEALAATWGRAGKAAEAVKLLSRALEARPGDEELLFALGAAHEQAGDFDQSLSRMRQIIAKNPEHARALNFIGYSLADRGRDLDDAEKLVLRAVQLKPDSGAFVDSLGWLYFKKGDFGKAVTYLERAVLLAPGEALIFEHLGDAYRGAGRPADALAAYAKALEALEANPEEALEGQRASLSEKVKALERAKMLGSDDKGR